MQAVIILTDRVSGRGRGDERFTWHFGGGSLRLYSVMNVDYVQEVLPGESERLSVDDDT